MKLRVENLARIKEAEVEVKNLTLFVGQNSTHKSYMAHVIYELYKNISYISHISGNQAMLSKTVNRTVHQDLKDDIDYILSLKNEISGGEVKYKLGRNEFHINVTRVKIYTASDDSQLNSIFLNIKKIILKELTKIINNSFNSDKKIMENIFIEENNSIINQKYITLIFQTPLESFEYKKTEISNSFLTQIIDIIINNLQDNNNGYKKPYYFPASRTGFVLTLDEIYAGIFRDNFRGQVNATRLSEPTIDFIQTFADIKNGMIDIENVFNEYTKEKNKKIKKLITFLEKNIIQGQIKEVKNEQDYTSYFLEVNGTELDLHLASSATLETLPFIVLLKNIEDISKTFFVIEEPEAHLHPKAQLQMARFLVMLSNAGAKVLVTTHSDYILNEINNCIKLDELNEKKEFSISKDSVSAYLLKNEKNETTVKKLEIDKYGISNDNFDEALEELLDTSNELNERIIDNE
jgi:predicted ATPase